MSPSDPREVEVVAAVIISGDKVFATQRGYGDFRGWWEFPGGKTESGESLNEALKREIREELNTEIAVGSLLKTVVYDYPTFRLRMHCFLCRVLRGKLELLEHDAAAWVTAEELDNLRWLPADWEILPDIQKILRAPFA